MSNIEVKDLIDENRYPTGWKVVWLGIYIPVGLLLVILRTFVAVQACLVAVICPKIPIFKSFIFCCARVVFGIIVKEDDVAHKNTSARVIVSNNVTSYDQVAVHFVTGCITPHVWELPSFLNWALGIKEMGFKQGRETTIANVRSHLGKFPEPVFFLPEGTPTNGRVGLLKFSVLPFILGTSVQPLTVRVHRPFVAAVAPTALATSPLFDLFYFMFVPYTVFTIRYLPVMRAQDTESNEDFTARVESAIAQSLGIVCTNYTAADKVEYEKRYLQELNQPVVTRNHNGFSNSELANMVRQVEEVLPLVPRNVVVRDLERTRSVDVTISNILDGSVTYTPLAQPRHVSGSSGDSSQGRYTSSASTSGQSSGYPKSSLASSIFSKSAQERMSSFQERKNQLIENARRKYIEKHNLKLVEYNC